MAAGWAAASRTALGGQAMCWSVDYLNRRAGCSVFPVNDGMINRLAHWRYVATPTRTRSRRSPFARYSSFGRNRSSWLWRRTFAGDIVPATAAAIYKDCAIASLRIRAANLRRYGSKQPATVATPDRTLPERDGDASRSYTPGDRCRGGEYSSSKRDH